jgi:hypothetical protein
MRRTPGPYNPRLAASWKRNIAGFRTTAFRGLEPDRYSGMPGVKSRRQRTGCLPRTSTTPKLLNGR